MPTSQEGFPNRLAALRRDIVEQARRVQVLLEHAFDAAFDRDQEAAQRAIAMDELIDTVDVEVEKRSVQLLTDATAAGAALPVDQLRMVLTIVKVNNELERIADMGVKVSELVPHLARLNMTLPQTHRVITNSVVGILRDAGTSLDRIDPHLAKVVLASESAIEEFKRAILHDAQVQVSTGRMSVESSFILHELTTRCEMIAEHCTNIAEQVLYVATGTIVRHMAGHWEEVPPARG